MALASFLLGLLPYIALGLIVLANATLSDLMNQEAAPGIPLYLMVGTVEYLGSHLVLLAALITGVLGLSRAGRYAPGRTWRGFALAGLALAIVGLIALVCLDIVVASISAACRSTTGC